MKWILSLIITLFLSVFSYCETLPDGTKYNLYNDFSGGINTRDPAHKLRINESPYIRNCYIDDGEIEPVNGSIIIGSTNTLQKVNLFKRYVKTDGVVEYIISDSSIVLKTQDFTNYTTLKTGLNNSYRLRAKQIEDKIYFTNGSNNVFTYNGTTVVVLDGGTYGAPTYKTPNVPKFKYIEYYQNRLWGFNLPDNPSALRWHLLLSTDTVPITYAPDHELAWSNSNLQLNIDKGNGTVGTFLRVYAGQLFVGKERGIHYIYGNEDANYSPVAIVKDYGFLSDESVVEQDNVLLGFGNDGIYEFNGQQMTRISDKIFPDIQNFQLGVNKTVPITWDNQIDFRFGTFSGTTVTVNGDLLLSTYTYNYTDQLVSIPDPTNLNERHYNFSISSFTEWNNLTWREDDVSGTPLVSSNTIPRSFLGYIPTMQFGYKGIDVLTPLPSTLNVCVSLNDRRYGIDRQCRYVNYDSNLNNFTITFSSKYLLGFNEVINSTIQYKIEASSVPEAYFKITRATWSSVIPLRMNKTTGSFISEVSTSTNNSGWNTFNSVYNLNGGNISFSYRAATSPVNIATYPFIPISAGSIIGSSQSNNYIQWAATINAVSETNPSYIENVTILYQIGGGSDVNPFGVSWKNRYYLAVTTTVSGDTSLIYVKSRNSSPNPFGWTVLEGVNVKSMLVTPDFWYAGASTSGVFYRMDYGSNFNGSAINQIYETNENNFEQPFQNKNVSEFGLDCELVESSTFTLSRSIDNGSWNNQDINNSGSGRMIRRLSYPYEKGNSFKWRFVNSQLDKPMTIYNWIVYFKENATRTNLP